MDCSPLGSSVHGILQAKILEWVAISSSRDSILEVISFFLKDIYIYLSIYVSVQFSSVQSLSCVRLFVTP